jgi:hypothetical protein
MTPTQCLVTMNGNQCGTCGADGQPCCGTGNAGQCPGGTGLVCTGRSRATGMPGTCRPAPVPDGGAG